MRCWPELDFDVLHLYCIFIITFRALWWHSWHLSGCEIQHESDPHDWWVERQSVEHYSFPSQLRTHSLETQLFTTAVFDTGWYLGFSQQKEYRCQCRFPCYYHGHRSSDSLPAISISKAVAAIYSPLTPTRNDTFCYVPLLTSGMWRDLNESREATEAK